MKHTYVFEVSCDNVTVNHMDLFLRDASIVITFDTHTTAPFTVEDLVVEGIIPSEDTIEDSIVSPIGPRILYGSSYIYEASFGRIMLLKNFDGPQPVDLSGIAHMPDTLESSALQLSSASKLLNLTSVGINFTVFAPGQGIENLTKNLPQGATPRTVGFTVPRKDFYATFTLMQVANDFFDSSVFVEVNFSGVVSDTSNMNSRLEQVRHFISERDWCLRQTEEVINELPTSSMGK